MRSRGRPPLLPPVPLLLDDSDFDEAISTRKLRTKLEIGWSRNGYRQQVSHLFTVDHSFSLKLQLMHSNCCISFHGATTNATRVSIYSMPVLRALAAKEPRRGMIFPRGVKRPAAIVSVASNLSWLYRTSSTRGDATHGAFVFHTCSVFHTRGRSKHQLKSSLSSCSAIRFQ